MTSKKKAGTSGEKSDRWRLLATGPAQARRRALEEVIQERGFVSVSDIALEIGVSEMTVRRDLLALEQNGRIERAHGGALPAARPTVLQVEPSFATRQDQQAEAKAAIARAAAGLIGDREIVAAGCRIHRCKARPRAQRASDARGRNQ